MLAISEMCEGAESSYTGDHFAGIETTAKTDVLEVSSGLGLDAFLFSDSLVVLSLSSFFTTPGLAFDSIPSAYSSSASFQAGSAASR